MKNILIGLSERDHLFVKRLKKEKHPLFKSGVKKFLEKAAEEALSKVRENFKEKDDWVNVLFKDMCTYFNVTTGDSDTLNDLYNWIVETGEAEGKGKLISMYWFYKKSKEGDSPDNIYEYMDRRWNDRNWEATYRRMG